MPAKFVQIHTLTNYPASLLNRDDAGFAKRMPFGGAVRTRISSQCLKRHWRVYTGEHSLATVDAPSTVRSRVAFERHLVQPLVAENLPEGTVTAAVGKIVSIILGSEAKQEKAAGRKARGEAPNSEGQAEPPKAATAQVTVLGMPELEYLRGLTREVVQAAGDDVQRLEQIVDERMRDQRELRENIRALMPGSLEAGLGAALFGRMVTGDVLSRCDAAIHVAHAITVHAQMTESDYFTAIDDLVREEGDQGSGHINSAELTSGLFYGYLVIDVDGLVANLGGGDRTLAGDVAERLVHIVATVSPGAKKGSTAPYAYSHLVLVESGKAQPRTLQNAFLDPVRADGDLVARTYSAMRDHLADLDAMYGKNEMRAHAGLRSEPYFEQKMSLSELACWTMRQVAE
jgi:CRISPR system Cascade subunit CasC